jgi:hypothetical protein
MPGALPDSTGLRAASPPAPSLRPSCGRALNRRVLPESHGASESWTSWPARTRTSGAGGGRAVASRRSHHGQHALAVPGHLRSVPDLQGEAHARHRANPRGGAPRDAPRQLPARLLRAGSTGPSRDQQSLPDGDGPGLRAAVPPAGARRASPTHPRWTRRLTGETAERRGAPGRVAAQALTGMLPRWLAGRPLRPRAPARRRRSRPAARADP